jgi:hypothetical protein
MERTPGVEPDLAAWKATASHERPLILVPLAEFHGHLVHR